MLNYSEILELFQKDTGHFALTEYTLLHGEILYAEKDGILTKVKNSGIYACYGLTENSADKILSLVISPSNFVCSSEFEVKKVKERFNFAFTKPIRQVKYENYLPHVSSPAKFKRLYPTEENIDLVFNTYTLKYPRNDIKSLMENNEFYYAELNGKIAGYIGKHVEGTIGLLEVFPEFRHKKIGSFLLSNIVNTLKDKGEFTYAQITATNSASVYMHEKLGIVPTERLIFWLYN